MQTKTYKLKTCDGLDVDKIAFLGAKHFSKPQGMKEKDFVQKIKKEMLNGYIDIVVRETTFRRRLG